MYPVLLSSTKGPCPQDLRGPIYKSLFLFSDHKSLSLFSNLKSLTTSPHIPAFLYSKKYDIECSKYQSSLDRSSRKKSYVHFGNSDQILCTRSFKLPIYSVRQKCNPLKLFAFFQQSLRFQCKILHSCSSFTHSIHNNTCSDWITSQTSNLLIFYTSDPVVSTHSKMFAPKHRQAAALKRHNVRFVKHVHSLQVIEMFTSSFHAFIQSLWKALDSLVDWFLQKAVPDHLQRFLEAGDWLWFWMELVIGLQHRP